MKLSLVFLLSSQLTLGRKYISTYSQEFGDAFLAILEHLLHISAHCEFGWDIETRAACLHKVFELRVLDNLEWSTRFTDPAHNSGSINL